MVEWYRLSVDEDQRAVIHYERPTPQCDLSRSLPDVSIDEAAADDLVREGAVRCPYCFR